MTERGGLRLATEADAPALARLLQDAYKENEKLGVEYNARAVTEERVRDYLARSEVWVLEEDGRLVATVGLGFEVEVRRLAVDPSARGRGLASRLLAFAEARAAERGYLRARLDVDGDHPWLGAFYDRHGWSATARVEFPQWEDWHVVRYEKRLPGP